MFRSWCQYLLQPIDFLLWSFLIVVRLPQRSCEGVSQLTFTTIDFDAEQYISRRRALSYSPFCHSWAFSSHSTILQIIVRFQSTVSITVGRPAVIWLVTLPSCHVTLVLKSSPVIMQSDDLKISPIYCITVVYRDTKSVDKCCNVIFWLDTTFRVVQSVYPCQKLKSAWSLRQIGVT